MDFEIAYQNLLPFVQKPGRYLGNERGMVRKDPGRVAVRFALAFPDVYEIAQSHPGLQLLYDLLNRREDVYAERVYAPWTDMEQELRRAGVPLVSLETFTPLHEFDILGFTLQYELTYSNILTMLDLGGIPLRSKDRDASHPLVVAGGPCAFNPEPVADFLDAILLGDGEEAIHDLCRVVEEWDGRHRDDLLAALAGIRGVYVPKFFEPEYEADGRFRGVRPLREGYSQVDKRILADLDTVPLTENFVVPTVQVVHGRPSLEVMRGCVKGCRFCQAGYIYRPLRERSPERVLAQAEKALAATGQDEVSLLSLSTGDYSCVNPVLTELMNRLTPQRVAVSLPSTRVDALAPSLLEQIRRVRKTGFTLAPEAGSQRLRDVIQKEYDEKELVEAARQIFSLGWRSLKLYFMLGLPTETEEDLLGIVDLADKVNAAGRYRAQVVASVSNFVPKPHTPFQWAPQITSAEIEARQELLKRELGKRKIKFRYHDASLSWLEGIFSRGDRRTGDLLQRAWELGCRFDGWNEACRLDLWEQALRETGLSAEPYLRRRILDEPLPWDHLNSGVTKKFLQRELSYAFSGTLTPDCSVERCTYCGACDFRTIRNVDYHIHGAKGSEHRGERIDHWARDVVTDAKEAGDWEPRGWHKIQKRRQERRRGGAVADPAVALEGLEAPSAPQPSVPTPAGKATNGREDRLGNAEEWLEAGGEGRIAAEGPGNLPARTRVRLQYRKVGLARFIGTLELTNLFYRGARRSALPIAFSQGHHPLPRLSFGPALPMGTESESEFLDIDFTEEVAPDAVQRAFAAEMPSGVELLDAWSLPLKAPSIGGGIESFDYEVRLDTPGLPGPDLVQERIAAFLEATEFFVTKRAKEVDRRIDARTFVTDLSWQPETGCLRMKIRFGRDGTLKPGEFVGALLGLEERAATALRIRKLETAFPAAFLPPPAMATAPVVEAV